MHLDVRLSVIASCVPLASRVADIGTDHGRLAVALLARDADTVVLAGMGGTTICRLLEVE